MNRYNLVTTHGRIYNDIELVIKFDCKDKWIFKDKNGQYIVLGSKYIDILEPRKDPTVKFVFDPCAEQHMKDVIDRWDRIINEKEG